jgi:hypothetical protein
MNKKFAGYMQDALGDYLTGASEDIQRYAEAIMEDAVGMAGASDKHLDAQLMLLAEKHRIELNRRSRNAVRRLVRLGVSMAVGAMA